MSDNPFVSPKTTEYGSPASPTKPVPAALTPICIICLILGLMGFLGSCSQGVFIPFQGSFEKMMEGVPVPIEQKEFQRIQMDAQKSLMVLYIVILVVNLIVGAMLFIGSIGGLQRKEGGRKILSLALVGAILYGVLKIGVVIYSYFATTALMKAAVADYSGEAPVESMEQMLQFTQMITAIFTGVSIVMAIALIAFYVWARMYINKPHVVDYCS